MIIDSVVEQREDESLSFEQEETMDVLSFFTATVINWIPIKFSLVHCGAFSLAILYFSFLHSFWNISF